MVTPNITGLVQNNLIIKYKPGEVIIEDGSLGKEMYLIHSGVVELFKKGDGWEVVLEAKTDGDIFGESALFENLPHYYSVRAKELTTLISINKEKLEKLICQQPSLVMTLFKRFSSSLRKNNEELLKNRLKKKTLPIQKVKKTKETSLSGINLQVKEYNASNNNNEQFLYNKNITCPICNGVFSAKAIRFSKLSVEKTELDFRKIYKDFEPLWYLNWVCPHCFYANIQNDFCKISVKDKALAENMIKILKDKVVFSFSEPRKIEEVLQSYYLAQLFTDDKLKKGQYWLRLSWLYQDLNDGEMYNKAVMEALNYFKELYYNNSDPALRSKEQQICYILGDLYSKKGDYDEGRKYFLRAKVHRGGSQIINRQAELRIDDIISRKK